MEAIHNSRLMLVPSNNLPVMHNVRATDGAYRIANEAQRATETTRKAVEDA